MPCTHVSLTFYFLQLYHDKVLYVDPSRQEEEFEATAVRDPSNKNEEWGQLTVGMMPKYASGQVALMVQTGQMEASNLVEGLELATDLCNKLYNLVKKVRVLVLDCMICKLIIKLGRIG